METEPDTALEQLAAQFDVMVYEARLVAPERRRPYLHVVNREATVLSENIYTGDGWFWYPFAEQIAPVTEVASAAAKIALVLRARVGHRVADEVPGTYRGRPR